VSKYQTEARVTIPGAEPFADYELQALAATCTALSAAQKALPAAQYVLRELYIHNTTMANACRIARTIAKGVVGEYTELSDTSGIVGIDWILQRAQTIALATPGGAVTLMIQVDFDLVGEP